METESKEAAMEGVGEISTAAVAASPGEADMKEIPAAAAQTGQLNASDGNLSTA